MKDNLVLSSKMIISTMKNVFVGPNRSNDGPITVENDEKWPKSPKNRLKTSANLQISRHKIEN